MRIVIWIGILIGLFLLICGNAAAEGTYPVNPDQAIVRELDRLGNKIGRRDGGAIVRGVSVTETQTPSLDQHGKWTIALTETPKGETLTEVRVAIQSPDPDGEYSTEFQIRLSENIAESCDFVAPGNYRIVAYYFFSGGTCYMGYQDFSISLDETHTAEDYPTVAQKVSQIVTECQVVGNDWQTALNLHDWLTHHVFYDRTYSFYGAEDALLRGTGVCDSYSKAYCYLLRAAGITVQRVHSDTHAWNVITLGNTEYHVDVTWDDPVMADENGIINRPVSGGEQYVYFCINDNLIYGFLDENAEHATGKTYTGATSLAESYLIHTNKWQDGGQYWDDETGNLGIYRDLIVDSIPNRAVGAFTVPADQDCIIEIFDDGRASACTGNEAYAKWARYFYAYKLNETGIPGLDGFTVTYDPEEMIFRATVGDGIILIDDKGNILQNGDSLSGKIQYKIRVANLPAGCDKLQFTWDDQNLSATAPTEWQDDWRAPEGENGKNYIYLLPELIGTYNSEVMFVRTGESDQNHRYITLNYNRTPKYDIPVSITNTTVPEYKENNYALTWSGSGSADFCVVIWEKPNESWEMFFCSIDGILRLEDYPEDMNPLDETGDHRVTIFAIKDDCIWMRPTAWSFAVAAPELVLRVDPTNNDTERIIVANDGSVTAAMHQWINFDVSAPGSCSGVGIYWLYTDPGIYQLSEEQSLSDVEGIPDYARCADCWPGDGWEEFTWTVNDAPDGLSGDSYTVYMVAEAQYDNWTKYKRAVLPVTVSVDQKVTGAVSYTVPETLNTFVDGVAQVARDGELIIEVDNANNDADFYGAYIAKAGISQSDHYWELIADSHWSTKESNTGTTQVQLPIPRCEAGKDYVVHVYAVKFGALQIEAAATTTIHAVEAVEPAADPTRGEVILSMKNHYDIGERLMIHACYLQPENPLHDVGWMDVQIYPVGQPQEPVYAEGGDWNDFYDVDFAIEEAGRYTVVARAMAYIEGQGTVTLSQSPEKTIMVSASGSVDQPCIFTETMFIGEYESIQIGVELGGYATEARANLDWNIGGNEDNLMFDEWAIMERSEGADDAGYDGYIFIFPEGVVPGAYLLHVDFYSDGNRIDRISKDIVILGDPYHNNSKIEMPNDLTEIEEEAFARTQAEVIIIEDNVTRIGERAFANSDVKYVVFSRETPEDIAIADDAFEGCNVKVVFGFGEAARDLARELQAYYYDFWRVTGDG